MKLNSVVVYLAGIWNFLPPKYISLSPDSPLPAKKKKKKKERKKDPFDLRKIMEKLPQDWPHWASQIGS